ncbi:MAG: GntR family transcriptional regulator [Lautropia sp.]
MPVALYQRIASELTRRITDGEFPAGSRLPTEFQLMSLYGASRNTVRSALAQLEEHGLVSRRRNRGTTVEAPPEGTTFSQPLGSLNDLINLASTARRLVHASSEQVLDAALARELGCAPGSRWLCIAMTRSAPNGRLPLSWTDAYVDPCYGDLPALARKAPDRLLSDLMEANYGRRIVKVEQVVTSCVIDGRLHEQLKLPAATHGLKVIRRYRDASAAIALATRSIYPGSRYAITTTLVRT